MIIPSSPPDPADRPFEHDAEPPSARGRAVLVVLLLVAAVLVVARISEPSVDDELVVDGDGQRATPTTTEEDGRPAPDPLPGDGPEVSLVGGSWGPMPAAAIPARTRHTATWTGEELLVFGGQPDPGPATGARFAPGIGPDGAWRPMASSPLGSRVGHTATWTGTELIIVEGAPVGQVAAVAAQELDGAAYDPATDSWRSIAPAPINPRSGHVAVWTGEELAVFGGSRVFEHFAPIALYDPVADSWRQSGPSPLDKAFGQAAAVWTGTEVLIWTGQGPADVAAYDPAADTWRLLPGAPVAMRSVSAVWTGVEMLLLGTPEPGQPGVGGAALDPGTGRWTVLPPSPQVFAATVAAVWTGRAAIVIGGPAAQPGAVWSPDLARWSPLPLGTQPALSGHSATWTGESLLVWGGQGEDSPINTGTEYRPVG